MEVWKKITEVEKAYFTQGEGKWALLVMD